MHFYVTVTTHNAFLWNDKLTKAENTKRLDMSVLQLPELCRQLVRYSTAASSCSHFPIKVKKIIIGRGYPQDCQSSRIPNFLEIWLKDGGEVLSLTRRPRFNSQEDSWYPFLLVAESRD
jgi:hypothetical protein